MNSCTAATIRGLPPETTLTFESKRNAISQLYMSNTIEPRSFGWESEFTYSKKEFLNPESTPEYGEKNENFSFSYTEKKSLEA